MIIIAGIAYFFWTILGMIFWIPLVVRVVAGFCGSLVYNMVTNNPENIQRSKESLDLALSFYVRGFINIKSALFNGTQLQNKNANSSLDFKPKFDSGSFIAQIIWTIIFWAGVILPFVGDGILGLFHRTEY
ncbi:MAG: hypothetical protein ABIR18_00025 [Chitinophagaceae bacterium]